MNQDDDFNNNTITSLDSFTLSRNPKLDEKANKKKYVDDTSGESFVLKFDETLKRFLNIRVGDTVHNLRKFRKNNL